MSEGYVCVHCREPVEMQRVGTLLVSSDGAGKPGDDVFMWVSLLVSEGSARCRGNGAGQHEVMGMAAKEYRTPS